MSTKQSHGLLPANLPSQQQQQVRCDVGHNGKQVMMVFTRPVPDLLMTPDQCDAHIAALQGAVAELREVLAKEAAANVS